MDKKWKDSQLENLKKGISIFHHIPNNIGNIVYCDTTESREFPCSEKEIKKRKILGILFAIISLTLLWGLLYEHYIWASILTLIILLISVAISDTAFKGTDYFIGEQGFSIVSFDKNRDNINEVKTIRFNDISYFFTGETINKVNFSYSGTNYYFTVYNCLNTEEQTYSVAYTTEGSYSDKSPKDPMNPQGASEVYAFMKVVEKQWTLYYISKHKDDEFIKFHVLKDNNLYEYIKISMNTLIIGDVEYNRMNTKRIYFSNGQLVVEHENHSKKLFGLIEKGNISQIPLADLGNKQAFMLLFDNFYKA